MDSKINAANEKKEVMGKLISQKYGHLKDILVDTPKDFIKENPWWAAGGLVLGALTTGIIFFFYQNQKKYGKSRF